MQFIPRLSAANITPSLNTIPRTLVPVTIGSLKQISQDVIIPKQKQHALCVLYGVGEGVPGTVLGSLVNGVSTIHIMQIIALSCNISTVLNQKTTTTYGTSPVCREVIHGKSKSRREDVTRIPLT